MKNSSLVQLSIFNPLPQRGLRVFAMDALTLPMDRHTIESIGPLKVQK